MLEGKLPLYIKIVLYPVQDPKFIQEGKKSQIFVMSDADVIKNVQEKKGQQVRQMPLRQVIKRLFRM